MTNPMITEEFGITVTNPETGTTLLLPRHFDDEEEAKSVAEIMLIHAPDSVATVVDVRVTIEQII